MLIKTFLNGFVIATAVLSAVSALATGAPDRAALLDLNQAGTRILAGELERTVLRDIRNQELPDYEDDLDYDVEVKVQDSQFSVGFDDLRLELRDGYLVARVNVERIRVDARRIKLKKRIFGGSLRSTCRDTTVKVGYDEPIPLSARIALSMRSGDIRVGISRVSFDIDEDNYDVDGPSSCSGDIGIGRLIRSLVRSLLDQSRGRIEDAIEDQVKRLGPDLAEILNQQTRFDMVFRVDLPPLPRVPVQIQTWPAHVAVTRQKLSIELGARAERPLVKSELKSKPSRLAVLGEVGFNPELLNEVIAAVVGDGIDPVEIDVDTVPGIDELLDTAGASAIWPDLLEAPLTDDRLKLGFALSAAPRFVLRESDQTLGLTIPSLPLHFWAPMNDDWVHYFVIDLALAADLEIVQEDNQILLQFAAPPMVRVGGRWSDDYTPTNDMFEQDIAATLLTSVFDYLYAAGPLWVGDVVLPDLGSGALRLSRPRIQSPFIKFSFTN